jgi:lipopolysaccharide export system permease protein
MLLVSTPFVVGVKRGVSTGARLLIGVVIGLGFNIIDMTTGHIALIYNLSPWLMSLLPSVTFSALAWVALKRVQ